MSTYLGNTTLPSAVKDRVLSTFQQAITLYKQGRIDEVVQGCGLILRMDPMFDPAKKLLEKTKNPSAPIDIDALIPVESDTMKEARAALDGRDFQRANDLTAELLRNDFTNDDARVINDTARERMEAAPFVEQFIRKAQTFAGQGNIAAARAELEKARALDSDHPGIRQFSESLTASETAAPAPSFTSGGSPSFVVDTPTPPPAARGAAQATDFGFTFEEEKAAGPEMSFDGFSFDTASKEVAAPQPVASPPVGSGGFSFDAPTPATGGFDFSTAPTATGGDDQRKIQQYLADGDRAAGTGDYQQAVDLWSRIFLIDVTNDEASQRIEKAKAKRREIETRVEALISAGEQAYGRDTEAARAKFNEALRLDPGNATANDYLGRMSNTVADGGAAGHEAPFTPPAPARDIFADDVAMNGSYDSLKPRDAVPAKKGVKANAPVAQAAAKRGSSMGVIATIAGVVIAAALGWFVWSKYMAKPAYDPSATQSTIHQAESLAQRGHYDEAIAKLQDVKPADPQHDKVLEMIADLQNKKSQAAETINGRPARVVYDESIAAGRTAFDSHDYDAAKKSL